MQMNREPAKPNVRTDDYLPFLAILVSAGSIFLPWFQIDLSASYHIYQTSLDLGNFNGAFAVGGKVALVITSLAALMLFFRIRMAYLTGLLNLSLGGSYLIGWLDFSGQLLDKSGKIGTFCCQLNPQYGLYLFIFSSLFLAISLVQSERAYREFLQKENLC